MRSLQRDAKQSQNKRLIHGWYWPPPLRSAVGTWVRDSGGRTTLESREWSTKNELTRERERAGTQGGSGERRSPPQAEVCGGAVAGPFLRLLQSFQPAKRVSGCYSTEHAVAAPVSSSRALCLLSLRSPGEDRSTTAQRPDRVSGSTRVPRSPAVARQLQSATGRVALAANSPGRRATLPSNGFQRVGSGGRLPGARSRGWGGASAL